MPKKLRVVIRTEEPWVLEVPDDLAELILQDRQKAVDYLVVYGEPERISEVPLTVLEVKEV